MNFLRLFFLILIPAALVGFFVLITVLGPKSVDYSEISFDTDISEVSGALRLKSIDFENTFKKIAAFKKIAEEDYILLLNAIKYQKQYIAQLPYYSKDAEGRLKDLEKRYDQVASEPYFEKSLEFELESKLLYKAEDFDQALNLIKEAIQYQYDINELFPLSPRRDLNRLAQLNRQRNYLEAYPLYRKLLEFEAKGDALSQEGEWEAAAEQIEGAVDLQFILNSEYRGSKLSDSKRLAELKRRYIQFKSERAYQAIESIIAVADKLIDQQEYLPASALYEEAMLSQRKLNELYPEGPYSSEDSVINLIRRSQTAASYQLGNDIISLELQIDNDLRNRNHVAAQQKVLLASNAISKMKEEFPKSSYNDDSLDLKIRYLNLIRNDIGFLQDRIYDMLLPVPGYEEIQMLKTEVTQALYVTIIGINPSRTIGDLKPVESVSWAEANEFCKRLSWVIGQTVRLPKEYEFRAALGKLRYVKLENHVISREEKTGLSDVASKDALNNGYQDLLGNLSEWLSSLYAYKDEPVSHIGGHFGDSYEVIYAVPKRTTNRNERSRLVGFRFVVEIP